MELLLLVVNVVGRGWESRDSMTWPGWEKEREERGISEGEGRGGEIRDPCNLLIEEEEEEEEEEKEGEEEEEEEEEEYRAISPSGDKQSPLLPPLISSCTITTSLSCPPPLPLPLPLPLPPPLPPCDVTS